MIILLIFMQILARGARKPAAPVHFGRDFAPFGALEVTLALPVSGSILEIGPLAP